MGKKNKAKQANSKANLVNHLAPKKVSPLKRNELNNIADKLLKLCSSSNGGKEWDTYIEVTKLLAKAVELESDMRVPVNDRSDAIPKFLEWLEKNEASFPGVSISSFDGFELGLKAEKDFEEGDLLMAIPRKIMLTLENARISELGALLCKDPMLQHMPNVALSLLLLLEKFKPDSHWAPYIDLLPSEYTTVLYFSPSELADLKGSPAQEAALKQCRNIARQYAYFSKLFQTVSGPACDLLREVFTYEQYRWAVSTVMTRQNFVVSSDGKSIVNALIPLWDLCNHEQGRLSTDFVPEKDRSECLAWRSFPKGEQIFIFYGARPNAEFLVHNGFVPSDNSHDTLAIRLGISHADPLGDKKRTLLNTLALPCSGEFLLHAGPEPVDAKLRAFLRVFSMTDELDHWLSKQDGGKDLEYVDCALDTNLESRAWTFLKTRVTLLLASYSTSLQEDEILLQSRGINPYKRLAVQQRLAEKKILHSTLNYAQQRLIQ
ncbi:actin-histidine N-methyltransferase [Neocloeon triangulifer]|uniref:actin-histidine N-methyltransferase n=1 Tax=Neocloeon triangulifer TaxID=2078957 RepID=UPI00286F6190|nr:actin-histidine N-methyltransferase [Neocloeon triangulifer]XP_059484831.1 actin-histidine N-methyltransferase [Neocloeon triangulifer]